MPLTLPQVSEQFRRRFGSPPALVARAPGRVNLIGEHTDYNDGFVLPMAIDRAVWIALRPRADRRVVVYSADFDQAGEFSLADFRHDNAGWLEYVKGVASVLAEAGHKLAGWEGVVSGDVPLGAGLSSSAAMEMVAARAFAAVSDLPWNPAAMAKLSQRAENTWVGVQCGIMDQLISAAGRAGHALLIDCRSLETESVPLPPGTAVVVLDTNTRRGLVDSAYNERRAQCETAARFFGVKALRDVSLAEFDRRAGALDEVSRRRARHVISENARTLEAAEAMRRGDVATMGRLMDASHVSLRDDFEVSSPALDTMVRCARRQEPCHGARMTGAGFGGCAVAIVAAESADGFAKAVAAEYAAETGLTPAVYVCQATNGAEVKGGE
ncbi:MAG: galactokinase [Pirellulales bacterium]